VRAVDIEARWIESLASVQAGARQVVRLDVIQRIGGQMKDQHVEAQNGPDYRQAHHECRDRPTAASKIDEEVEWLPRPGLALRCVAGDHVGRV
jgi:cellulase/cellobiase CelA1